MISEIDKKIEEYSSRLRELCQRGLRGKHNAKERERLRNAILCLSVRKA
jgi:hypothetical protein